jgi:hypothetical protein
MEALTMSSKFQRLIASILILLCAGCGLKIGDGQPALAPVDAGLGASTECLSDTAPAFGKFIDGSAQPKQVSDMWDCYASVLDTFEKNSHGSYKDRFTAQELATFIQRHFISNPNIQISETLITEVFRIKRMLVGGDATDITRTEIFTLIDVIQQLKQISLQLLPYMRVYSSNWKVGTTFSSIDQDVAYFEMANSQIQAAASTLGALIQKNGQSYPLDSAVTLVQELEKVTGSNWTWISTLQDAMPLVKKLKQTLSGGEGDTVAPTEWKSFALLGSRGYIQYLRYHYFIADYDAGGAGPQMIYIMNSIDDLFSYLGDMVDGKPNKTLTRQELLEICQSLESFFPGLNITDDLLVQVMKIKVVFFGGQIDQFVKADFDRAREKVQAFQTLSSKFLTYIAVYGMSWNQTEMTPEQAQTYFQNADTNLTEVGRRLGQIMEATYDLNDLVQLATDVDQLYPTGRGTQTWQVLAQKYVPLVVSAKNLVFADQDSIIGKQSGDWSDLLQYGAEGYSRFLYYYYFLRNADLLTGNALGNFDVLVRQSVDIVDQLIARRPSSPVSTITFAELSNVWASVLKTGIFPAGLSQKSLDNLTKVVLQKLLIPPDQRLMGDLPNGLTKSATQTIRQEFAMWLEGQNFIDLMYQGQPEDAVRTPDQVLSDISHAVPTTELNELKMIFSGPVPLAYDSLDRIHIGGTAINYTRRSMDWVNLSRAIVRLILRSYAMDINRVNNYAGITVDEANAFYADIRPAATEMNLFDLRNDNFMTSRFRDANLFTPSGNGDAYADFNETNELVLMLLSGVQIDGMISPEVQKICPVTPSTTGYADDATMNFNCFQQGYYQNMPTAFSSLPDFLKYAYGLSHDDYNTMLTNLMKAAGYVDAGNGMVKIGDTSMIPHVAQYVESLFATYDKDHTGRLDETELNNAYTRFQPLITQFASQSGIKSPHMIRALFFWLVHYGKAPETTYEKIKYVVWWCLKSSWDVGADRQRFAEILGYIADLETQASSSGQSKIKKTYIPDDMQRNPQNYHQVPAGGYPDDTKPGVVDPNDR